MKRLYMLLTIALALCMGCITEDPYPEDGTDQSELVVQLEAERDALATEVAVLRDDIAWFQAELEAHQQAVTVFRENGAKVTCANVATALPNLKLPIAAAHPLYQSMRDRDGDGEVCE